MMEVNSVREMKAALRVRRAMRREEEERRRRGGKVKALQTSSICQWTPDHCHRELTDHQRELTDHRRDTVVCRLASQGAAKTDPTKIASRCGRKIPKLSSVCKVSQ